MRNAPPPPPSAPLPPEREDFWPIYRPKAGQSLRGVILSEELLGVYTHWIDGHEIACVAKTGLCACRRAPISTRWTGFVCWCPEDARMRPGILPITDHAARNARWLLGSQVELRGVRVEYRRDAGSSWSPCWCLRVEPRWTRDNLPPPFDIWQGLTALWYRHHNAVNRAEGTS